MSLEEQVKQIVTNFDGANSVQITKALDEIKSNFKSELTRDYLQGKITAISEASDEAEKKKLCKNLLPYFDWYLQGL